MLVLGESVLIFLIADAKGGDYYRTYYLGIVTVILLHMHHFQPQPLQANLHALHWHKNAGIFDCQIFPIYLATLVTVSASYKLCLYILNDDWQQQLLFALPMDYHHNRGLARGGEDDGCSPTGDKRKQLIPNLFCYAMGILFVCFDLINVA